MSTQIEPYKSKGKAKNHNAAKKSNRNTGISNTTGKTKENQTDSIAEFRSKGTVDASAAGLKNSRKTGDSCVNEFKSRSDSGRISQKSKIRIPAAAVAVAVAAVAALTVTLVTISQRTSANQTSLLSTYAGLNEAACDGTEAKSAADNASDVQATTVKDSSPVQATAVKNSSNASATGTSAGKNEKSAAANASGVQATTVKDSSPVQAATVKNSSNVSATGQTLFERMQAKSAIGAKGVLACIGERLSGNAVSCDNRNSITNNSFWFAAGLKDENSIEFFLLSEKNEDDEDDANQGSDVNQSNDANQNSNGISVRKSGASDLQDIDFEVNEEKLTQVEERYEEAVEAQKEKERREKEAAEFAEKHKALDSLTAEYNPKMDIEPSAKERAVLEKIVEAEARDQDTIGKVLVANVILNRMNSKMFADSISGVVFERIGGSAQFAPTVDGNYEKAVPSKHTIEAVDRALSGEDYSRGALYFFQRSGTTAKKARWFDVSLDFLFKYGTHEFYTEKKR